MKLILRRDVEKLGKSGDLVRVKPGFARNYLLPQGLAYLASPASLRRIEEERRVEEERLRKLFLEAGRQAAKLKDVAVHFEARASDEGRLFGSVTARHVFDSLSEQGLDFELERRQLVMDAPIKELGEHQAIIRLADGVETPILVTVSRLAG